VEIGSRPKPGEKALNLYNERIYVLVGKDVGHVGKDVRHLSKDIGQVGKDIGHVWKVIGLL